jgi:murein DD-endopeptidase MepM/ murein hydrolase activator NlpD
MVLPGIEETLSSISVITSTPTTGVTRPPQPTVTPPRLTPVKQSPTVTATAADLLAPTTTKTPIFHICSPLNGYPRARLSKIISNGYKPPPPGSDDRHQGVDFVFHRQAGEERNILGVATQTVMYGTVAAAVHDSFPFGNLVIVETPYWHLPPALIEELGMAPDESLYHLYAHLQEDLRVELGQKVSSCQVVGTVGASGNTEAPHLHLETRIGPAGAVFPVMNAFSLGVTPEERANYVLWRTSMVFRHFDPMSLMNYGLAQ